MTSCETFTELVRQYRFYESGRGAWRRSRKDKATTYFDYTYDIGGYYTLVRHVNYEPHNMPVNNLKSLRKLLTLFYT